MCHVNFMFMHQEGINFLKKIVDDWNDVMENL